MGHWSRIVASLALICAAIYASIFPIAELFTEVIILRTYDAKGEPRDTRLTVIDIDGTAWVRGRCVRARGAREVWAGVSVR